MILSDLEDPYVFPSASSGPSRRQGAKTRFIELKLVISKFLNHRTELKKQNHWAVLELPSKIYNLEYPFDNHLSLCMEEHNDSTLWENMDSTASSSNTRYADSGAKDLLVKKGLIQS